MKWVLLSPPHSWGHETFITLSNSLMAGLGLEPCSAFHASHCEGAAVTLLWDIRECPGLASGKGLSITVCYSSKTHLWALPKKSLNCLVSILPMAISYVSTTNSSCSTWAWAIPGCPTWVFALNRNSHKEQVHVSDALQAGFKAQDASKLWFQLFSVKDFPQWAGALTVSLPSTDLWKKIKFQTDFQ